jgi:hypothetical protein
MAKSTKTPTVIENVIPPDLEKGAVDVSSLVEEFAETCKPLEKDRLLVLMDARTKARYCECHIGADKLVSFATVDVPLDPEGQSEYRANREIVADHEAFYKMKEDALARRTFSNIVAEFITSYDAEHPLKIIGGQHRYEAIKLALEQGVTEAHGVKVYFELDADQRLDVQLISNTNIAVSKDLFDRMQETVQGPELRIWCQAVGLLESGNDFADKRQRGKQITVQAARTFILNYYRGRGVEPQKFDSTDTTPIICESGVVDTEWNKFKAANPGFSKDAQLIAAGKEFALLVQAQKTAIVNAKSKTKTRTTADFAEKALNFAVLSAWAYVSGTIHANPVRLKRHYELRNSPGKDPLNAVALAKGRHKSDPENYRGLGYRTDAKERGRFVELFYAQAESGSGISSVLIDVAIKKYHAKQAILEVLRAEQKVIHE